MKLHSHVLHSVSWWEESKATCKLVGSPERKLFPPKNFCLNHSYSVYKYRHSASFTSTFLTFYPPHSLSYAKLPAIFFIKLILFRLRRYETSLSSTKNLFYHLLQSEFLAVFFYLHNYFNIHVCLSLSRRPITSHFQFLQLHQTVKNKSYHGVK